MERVTGWGVRQGRLSDHSFGSRVQSARRDSRFWESIGQCTSSDSVAGPVPCLGSRRVNPGNARIADRGAAGGAGEIILSAELGAWLPALASTKKEAWRSETLVDAFGWPQIKSAITKAITDAAKSADGKEADGGLPLRTNRPPGPSLLRTTRNNLRRTESLPRPGWTRYLCYYSRRLRAEKRGSNGAHLA